MTTAKIVRDEASKAFELDQKSSSSYYKDLVDVIPSYCSKYKHPVIDGVGVCLCKMLCCSDQEVVMAAVIFLNSEPETESFELDDSALIVFIPDSAKSDLISVDSINEIVEAYSDRGAMKVPLADLVSAYNKVNKTNIKI